MKDGVDRGKADVTAPPFLQALREAYNARRKNVIALTGDVGGLFHSPEREAFVTLEQLIQSELSDLFNLVRVDMANGITFYDESVEKEVTDACEASDALYRGSGRKRVLEGMIEKTRHNPLPTLVLLKDMALSISRLKHMEQPGKPLCIIIQYAGALLPAGDIGRLSELDRQRLVFFLDWIGSPLFAGSSHLVVLVSPVRAELNARVFRIPHVSQIEIELPGYEERIRFVKWFVEEDPVAFETGAEDFAEDSAGLTLHSIRDMLMSARSTGEPVSRETVIREVNALLQARLGNIIRIKYPTHTPADIIGYESTREIFHELFERCEDSETAISAILVSGANGGGKSFQMEAYAVESGRVVIELAGLRGSLFGQTDSFFELLRWHIRTLGKILILVDEAHTAFGSVHSSETHQTEKRLAGNIIKMMSDKSLLGKVLWGLMTSRPDELDPDIKSRCPIQIPIFDLEGDERSEFVSAMFGRKGIRLEGEELVQVLGQTEYYSARDYDNFVREVLTKRRKSPEISVLEVLQGWNASMSIRSQREFQTLIALLHCTYPKLRPERLGDLEEEEIVRRIRALRIALEVE